MWPATTVIPGDTEPGACHTREEHRRGAACHGFGTASKRQPKLWFLIFFPSQLLEFKQFALQLCAAQTGTSQALISSSVSKALQWLINSTLKENKSHFSFTRGSGRLFNTTASMSPTCRAQIKAWLLPKALAHLKVVQWSCYFSFCTRKKNHSYTVQALEVILFHWCSQTFIPLVPLWTDWFQTHRSSWCLTGQVPP